MKTNTSPSLHGEPRPAVASSTPTDGTMRPHVSLFFRKLLRHGLTVAAMKPARKSPAGAHCKLVDATKPQVIVEIGPGTGAVKTAVAQQMHKDSRLIAVEIGRRGSLALNVRHVKTGLLPCET